MSAPGTSGHPNAPSNVCFRGNSGNVGDASPCQLMTQSGHGNNPDPRIGALQDIGLARYPDPSLSRGDGDSRRRWMPDGAEPERSLHAWVLDLPPTALQKRLALGLIVATVVAFVAVLPVSGHPLVEMNALFPSLDAIVLITDMITAVLLFAQFSLSDARPLLALATGYLFTALIVVPHALTFAGAFSPGGLLGAGVQTGSWLFIFWHLGFALGLLAYAALRIGKPIGANAENVGFGCNLVGRGRIAVSRLRFDMACNSGTIAVADSDPGQWPPRSERPAYHSVFDRRLRRCGRFVVAQSASAPNLITGLSS